MLKFSADIRSVIYMIITTSLLYLNWTSPSFNWFFWLGSMAMATTCFAMAHNHNHVPMWKSKGLNVITDYWLTLFYGFPVYVWKPTHNMNHHKYNNTDKDYTKTYRLTEKNNLFTMLSFPIISAVYQQTPITDYLKMLWKNQKSGFFYAISQYVLLIAYLAAAFAIDWEKALLYVLLPQQFAVQFVLIINYIQHVHADEESEFNHSRNFTGLGSWFLLNNGLHTAHHENMGMHWSELPKAHAELAPKIDPSLNEKSLAWFIFRVYVLGLVFKRFQTKSMRLERLEKELAPNNS